jgi:hypothetical protein
MHMEIYVLDVTLMLPLALMFVDRLQEINWPHGAKGDSITFFSLRTLHSEVRIFVVDHIETMSCQFSPPE